jgi:hypothetical protein
MTPSQNTGHIDQAGKADGYFGRAGESPFVRFIHIHIAENHRLHRTAGGIRLCLLLSVDRRAFYFLSE